MSGLFYASEFGRSTRKKEGQFKAVYLDQGQGHVAPRCVCLLATYFTAKCYRLLSETGEIGSSRVELEVLSGKNGGL